MKKLVTIAFLLFGITTATFAQTEKTMIPYGRDIKTKKITVVPSSFTPPSDPGTIAPFLNGMSFCGSDVVYLVVNDKDDKKVTTSYIFYRMRNTNSLSWLPVCETAEISGIPLKPAIEKPRDGNTIMFATKKKSGNVTLWREGRTIRYELADNSLIAAK